MENQTYEKEIILELAKLIQREAGSANEILKLTKELDESLHRDDRVSVQMLLEMRKEEMDKIDSIQKKIEILLDSCPLDIQAKLAKVVQGQGCDELEAVEITQVTAIIHNMKNTIRQAQVIDKVMSVKLAGGDSFYAQSESK